MPKVPKPFVLPATPPMRLSDTVTLAMLLSDSIVLYNAPGIAYNGLTWHKRSILCLGDLIELGKPSWVISTHFGYMVKAQSNDCDKKQLWQLFRKLTESDWSTLKPNNKEGIQRLIKALDDAMEEIL